MYQCSQCSLCWSRVRHCHHSNIPSHNWVCLSCTARWWPMMGSPQDNLWRRSPNSLHITALYLSSVTYGASPKVPFGRSCQGRCTRSTTTATARRPVFLSSHGTSYHVDSPAMFFVNSCWGKIDKSSKQESVFISPFEHVIFSPLRRLLAQNSWNEEDHTDYDCAVGGSFWYLLHQKTLYNIFQ